jgi:hypothetical protein
MMNWRARAMLRKPGLVEGDPRNLLPPEGLQRVRRAHLDAERMRNQALAKLHIRYLSEPNRNEANRKVSFADYLCSGQGFIDWTEAHVEAARTVLYVLAEEFRKLHLPESEFLEIMREEIEGAVKFT